MDKESTQAANLLGAIAESNYKLSCFADHLRKTADPAEISLDFECSRNSNYFDYGTGSPYLFNWYIDARFRSGRSLAVIIDLFWTDQKWFVDSRVETSGDNAPIPLISLPEHEAASIAEFIEVLELVTTEILDGAKHLIQEKDN